MGGEWPEVSLTDLYEVSSGLSKPAKDVGSANPSLNRNHVHPIEVKWPELKIQKQISHILGSLDDKIELNRKINETLEAMAQALFKSWFVDFDPVIDNALKAGNPIPEELAPKAAARKALGKNRKPLPENIQKLFPNEFICTDEMGWIPKGWVVGKLLDVCKIRAGYAYKSRDFSDKGIPVLKIKNINSGKTINIDDVQYIPPEIAEKTKDFWLKSGDVLIAMTGATVGKFGIPAGPTEHAFLLNQRVAKFEPITEISSSVWFAYCTLSLQRVCDYIVKSAMGSAQPNISATAIGYVMHCCRNYSRGS